MKKILIIFIIIIITFTTNLWAYGIEDTYTDKMKEFISLNNLVQNSVNYSSVSETIKKNTKKLENIVVAILDSGIDKDHEELKDYIVPGYNFVENSSTMYDDSGHGTLVAGIIGSKSFGLSTGVQIMPIKILDNNGFGKTENLVKGIIWAVDNGANIINISIGRDKFIQTNDNIDKDAFNEIEYNAIKYALLNNVTVVMPCGDFNKDDLCYPAAYDFTHDKAQPIIVSGVEYGEKFLWSNTSSNIDVAAPANNILSTIPKSLDYNIIDFENTEGDGYSFCGGTSMASAYVTALAAIIKSCDNSLSNIEIKEIITGTTDDIGTSGKDNVSGYGRINFEKCLNTQRIRINVCKSANFTTNAIDINLNVVDNYNNNVNRIGKYIISDHSNMAAVSDSISKQTSSESKSANELENEGNSEFIELNSQEICIDIYQYYNCINNYLLKEKTTRTIEESNNKLSIPLIGSGLYKIISYDKDNNFCRDIVYFEIRPNRAECGISSGVYFIDEDIVLSSTEEGAKIYYSYDEPVLHNGSLSSYAQFYNGILRVYRTSNIEFVVEKNGVLSDVNSVKVIIFPFHFLIIVILAALLVIILLAKKYKYIKCTIRKLYGKLKILFTK